MLKKLINIILIAIFALTVVNVVIDLSSYASGTKTVHFDYRGAAPMATAETWDYRYSIPRPPKNEEIDPYIEGWYFDANYQNKIEDWSSGFPKDDSRFTIYAKLKPIKITYSFFEVDRTPPFVVEQGEYAEPLAVAPDEPHISGWYFDKACTEKVDLNKSLGEAGRPYGETTIYAKWETNIVFHYGSGLGDETRGWGIYTPPENKYIEGWYKNEGLTEPFDFEDPMDSYMPTINIYPKWDESKISTDIADGTYEYIDFDSDGKQISQSKSKLWSIKESTKDRRTVLTDEALISTDKVTPGWYIVEGDVSISDRIVVKGDVHIILQNGCRFRAEKGISVTKGNSISIYAQSADESVMGRVIAKSGGSGTKSTAAIGSGSWFDGKASFECGDITINGGHIVAKGEGETAGIGAGYLGCVRSTITINGGIIEAEGSLTAAGIGCSGGSGSWGGIININGGTVLAVGGEKAGAGIGKGQYSNVDEVNIKSDMSLVRAGTTNHMQQVKKVEDFAKQVSENRYALITDGKSRDIYTVTYNTNGADEVETEKVEKGGQISLPEITQKKAAISDSGWYKESNFINTWDEEADVVNGNTDLYAKWLVVNDKKEPDCENPGHAAFWNYCGKYYTDSAYQNEIDNITEWLSAGGAGYTSATGHDVDVTAGECTKCHGLLYIDEEGVVNARTKTTELTTTTTELEDGEWYYVHETIDIDEPINVSGNVNIILKDGAVLNANKGINVPEYCKLTISSQTIGNDMGVVNATGRRHYPGIGGETCGTIAISGCNINAIGGEGAPAIGSPFEDSGDELIIISYENALVKTGKTAADKVVSIEDFKENHTERYASISFYERELLKFIDSEDFDIKSGTIGTSVKAIDFSKAVSGGLPEYTFSTTGLPLGISISKEGVLTGKFSGVSLAGKATIKVTDLDGKEASIEILYEKIIPKTTQISKTTPLKKGFTVKWKKTNDNGYEVRYSLNKNMTKAKVIRISKKTIVTKKITKLKPRKKYFVQVRTFKTLKGVRVYSNWSSAKAVITKK